MDGAVGLVQAWLRVNGYFTVTEYPVVEAQRFGGPRTLTDVDLLAFRFPGAGPRPGEDPVTDGLLGPRDRPDMLVGEVKEGHAELNRAARDPAVLAAALTRFGCCHEEHVEAVVGELRARGRTITHTGHAVRLVAFGSTGASPPSGAWDVILLGDVLASLRAWVRRHWGAMGACSPKDAALNQLVVEEKARRGATRRRQT